MSPIDAEGIVSDPEALVDVNGISAVVSGDGRFIATGILLSKGENVITAHANFEGITALHTINVNYTGEQIAPISISIISPEANATINRAEITVSGTFVSDAEEISINVNGIFADIYSNKFVANGIPLVEGDNVIIVNALDSNGAIGRAEITLNAVTTAPYITLSSNITSGISPLTTYFSVSTEISGSVTNYEMDFEGDGVIDYTGTTFEDINYTYTTEGIYYPTITITDDQGNIYTDTIGIIVLNKAEIDALLKGKWEGMKGNLSNQDVEKGLEYFLESSKEAYRQAFNIIIDKLPQIISDMQDIEMIYLKDGVAKYRINRIHDINGTLQTITYYIYFVKDTEGIWKIDRF
jgi:PKD repeat protein